MHAKAKTKKKFVIVIYRTIDLIELMSLRHEMSLYWGQSEFWIVFFFDWSWESVREGILLILCYIFLFFIWNMNSCQCNLTQPMKFKTNWNYLWLFFLARSLPLYLFTHSSVFISYVFLSIYLSFDVCLFCAFDNLHTILSRIRAKDLVMFHWFGLLTMYTSKLCEQTTNFFRSKIQIVDENYLP